MVAEAPRLRPDLVVRRIVGPEDVSYVVKDPAARKYFRFPESAGRLLAYLDGRTPLDAVQAKLRAAGAVVLSLDAIERFVQQLRGLDLIELSPAERMEHQLERFRRERRLRVRSRNAFGSLLHARFSLFDPDRWMGRTVHYLWFLWTPAFFWLSLAAILTATAINAANWQYFAAELARLLLFQASPQRYVAFTLVGFAVIAIHELGHGFTCKHFGGHVHELGVLLLYFMPCFYCNVDDAWLFERRSERLWVTFAGGYIELFVGALATFTWWFTDPAHPIHDLAFIAALIGGVSSVAVNLNPLIKLDGYYALSDYLGVPNLREHAFRYLRAAAQRLLGSSDPLPAVSPRRRRIFLTYGLLASAYSMVFLVLGVGRMFSMAVTHGRDWGVLIFALIAGWAVVLPALRRLGPAGGEGRGEGRGREAGSTRRGAGGPVLRAVLAAGVFIALVTVPRWSMPIVLDCVLEPGLPAAVRASGDAEVVRVDCREGEEVAAGQALLVLRTAGQAGARVRRALPQFTLTSPLAGICLTPRPEELTGRAVRRGEQLVTVADTSRLVAAAQVEPEMAWEARPGMPALLISNERPGTVVRARVDTVLPLMEPSAGFRLAAPLENAAGLRCGTTGTLKLYGPKRSLAGHLWQAFLRLARLDLWG